MVTGNSADRYDPNVVNSATGTADLEYQRYFAADTSSGHIEAQGTDVIVYEIYVPAETRSLTFNINVANDYCIDIIAPLYSNRIVKEQKNFYAEPLSEDWEGGWSITSFDTKHCIKASGNVKDGSNQSGKRSFMTGCQV